MSQALYRYVESPVGRLLLAGTEAGVSHLLFVTGPKGTRPRPEWRRADEAFEAAACQLAEYFEGERRTFDIPLAAGGTAFQRRVWDELVRIPYGETISYGDLARRVGNPLAARAVGLANGANPISIVVPCHRVVGASGNLVGYGGGLPVKRLLLEHERRCRWERPG